MTNFDLIKYDYDIKRALSDEEYAKFKGLLIKKQNDLYILKYYKHLLNEKNILDLGLFRSIITDGKKILAFSPPKSISSEIFTSQFDIKECILEEFVEGTMINCFYYNNEWMIATRWNIGGRNSFYQGHGVEKTSFYEMFMEAMKECNLSFDKLSPDHSYSFVLQHPNNRIVVPFIKPHLVLVAIYNTSKPWQALENTDLKISESSISYPRQYPKTSLHWDECLKPYTSLQTDYKILGVMLKHSSGVRSKVRNPIYEKVRYLKGNSPKIQYQYYHLYQQGKVKEFLKYFPEYKQKFWDYRNELCGWTNELWFLYKEVYIQKIKNILHDVAYQFIPHLKALHHIYISELREQNLFINRNVVINYIYNLNPARLMYAINYPLRQKQKDDVKGIPQMQN